MNKVTQKALETLRSQVRQFRDDREHAKQETERVKKEQPLLIATMRELGIDNENGILIDASDKSKGVAYVQQNKGSLVWDQEKIMDWLDKKVAGRPQLKKKTQSLVFDVNKWEALVSSGEVPAKIAAKFQHETEPPAPFIRFGKESDGTK